MDGLKPACPDHPDSHVSNARVPGRGRIWICITCGKVLGQAPTCDDESELVEIGPAAAGPIKP